MSDRVPAEVFPPGEFLREELEERGWSQVDLAEILGRGPQSISDIILGKRGITPDTAKGLALAFDTSAEYWLNLESSYRLSQVKEDDNVSRRARLYTVAPMKEMMRRSWIEPSDSLDVLEQGVLDFFECTSVDEGMRFWPYAARKSTPYQIVMPSQVAWLFRAKQMAQTMSVDAFSRENFNAVLGELHTLLQNEMDTRHVPRVLADAGIRFLIVEALPQTRIDGACFWLDSKSPVVVLSLRYDRVDYFWHTVMHELCHVRNEDGLKNYNDPLDTDIVGTQVISMTERPDFEKEADRFAVENLIPQEELQDFIARVSPLYSKIRLRGFADLRNIHPGIVVGQLQHNGEISYSANREMLVKVRDIISEHALTDGWGDSFAVTP